MKSCTQAKIETAFVRFLAAAVVGALVYIGAEPAAHYFNVELPANAPLIASGVLALVGWFVTKNLVDFTTDCMDVPASVAPALNGRATVAKPTARVKVTADTNPAKGRLGSLAGSPALAAVRSNQYPVVIKSPHLAVTVSQNPDGTLSVVSVAVGVSNSEYKNNNGIRATLENVREISWQHPTRDTSGARRMEGKVAAGSNHDQVVARLAAIVERKGA